MTHHTLSRRTVLCAKDVYVDVRGPGRSHEKALRGPDECVMCEYMQPCGPEGMMCFSEHIFRELCSTYALLQCRAGRILKTVEANASS